MKILIINLVCEIRITGRIVTNLADEYMIEGHDVKIAYGREAISKEYPKSILGNLSKENYCRKCQFFGDVNNMMLITLFQWLADLAKQRFLQDYPV